MPLVETPTPRPHGRLIAAVLRASQPLFRLHLALYRREVARAPYPRDARRMTIDGPDPVHLLFVGSIAVDRVWKRVRDARVEDIPEHHS